MGKFYITEASAKNCLIFVSIMEQRILLPHASKLFVLKGTGLYSIKSLLHDLGNFINCCTCHNAEMCVKVMTL